MTDQATFLSHRRDGVPVLEARGEFDIGNVGDLREAIKKAIEDSDVLILSLVSVSYLDSSALGVLIGASRMATTQRRKILIVAPRDTAAGKLLRIAAIDQIAPVFESADDAVATLGPDSH